MTTEIKNFKFPTWTEIVERNRPFLEHGEYKGYRLQVPVTENLYLLIDCQNNSQVFPDDENIIRFAWCTNNEFAISSIKYPNSEEGYIMGCAHLISAANEFKKCFEDFAVSNAFDMRRRIQKYNAEHPALKAPN
jgi:hypothetical protein